MTTMTSFNFSGWAELPRDLLDEIFARLGCTDRHLFGWICTPWRGYVKLSAPPFPVPFEPPRLLLYQPDSSISFFDVFNGKRRACPFTHSHPRARCLGYHSGWFFLVSNQNASQACLLNPVLAAEVPLPDLEFPIRKAVLSAPPGFPNCAVAVMGQSNSLVALCEPAGKRWHRIDLEDRILRDIIFWQNQVCALDKHGNVFLCNFDMESRITSILTVEAPKPRIWENEVEGFLVESINGDLLVVIRATGFLVFRLYLKCCWMSFWADMIDLGDQALFVGDIRSESVSVSRFPGSGLVKNSIYQTSRKFSNGNDVDHIAVVYSMESQVTSVVPVCEQLSVLADPVWVSPHCQCIPPLREDETNKNNEKEAEEDLSTLHHHHHRSSHHHRSQHHHHQLHSSYFFGWADLPGELLDEIFARLSGTDRHLFGWICSPWRGIARFSCLPFPVPFEPPRLLLHQSDNSISFFDVFNRKPRHCPLITPSHHRSRCLGYHLGWFVLVSDQDQSKTCLLNPVLATEIPLPDLEFLIKKAILSAPPGFPNCVAAVVGQSDSLALCEPAGNKWHQIDLWNRTLRDVMFWHNQVCALDKHGKILICDFDTDLQVTGIETVEAPKPYIWDSEVDGFLVESIDGKLLVVIRHGENKFIVFELYRNMNDWWADLSDLRDAALFLGQIRSESVPVDRFPGSSLRKNSIYLVGKKFGNAVAVHSMWPPLNEIPAVPVPQQHSALAEPVWVSPVIWP